jgi:hypothetical protein
LKVCFKFRARLIVVTTKTAAGLQPVKNLQLAAGQRLDAGKRLTICCRPTAG